MTTNTNAATWTDKQYLEQLAAHYQHSPVPEIRSHHERLMKIAAALTTAAAVPAIPDAITHTIQRALVKFSDSELERLRTLLEPKNAAVAMFGTARIAAQQNIDDADAALNWLAAAPKAESVQVGEYPPMPAPFIGVQDRPWGGHAEVIRSAIGEDGVVSCYTEDQMRAYADATCAMRAQAAPAAVAGMSEAVAYLDIGGGGYLDLGSDLSDEALRKLPKGRHMLAIVGTYGVDGYVPVAAPTTQATPQPTVQQEPVAIVTRSHDLGGEIDWTSRAKAPVGAKLYLAAPVAQGDALTDTYVQQVPDKCDRIVWRGRYYHLPIDAAEHSYTEPSPMAKVAAALRQKVEQEDAAYQARRSDQGLMESEWGPMEDAPPHEDPPMHVAVVEGDDTVRTLQWNRDVAAFAYPAGTLLYAARSQAKEGA